MGILTRLLAVVAAALAFGALAVPANAQATRTWVSGVGDDVNPCSRTAPCKTFAGAISKTAAGGEINCLDPGGFGTVTITKSITLDCTGTFGSILNSGGINGIAVNDSATGTPGTIDVILRGIVINGAGTTPGLNGINFVSGKSLYVEDVLIENQRSGSGIRFAPAISSGGFLHVINTEIVNSGSAAGGGIFITPVSPGFAQANLTNVQVRNNTNSGLRLESTNGLIGVTVEDSSFDKNQTGISMQGTVHNTIVLVNDSTFTNNSIAGLSGNGGTTAMRVDNSTITGNTIGVSTINGASIFSYGGNRLDANPTTGAANNGAFTGSILPRK